MRIGRTLAPAASPIGWQNYISGLKGWAKGPTELDRFAREINDFFGVSSSFYLSSGKAAIAITLKSLKDLYPDKDEVLIPAYTCYSVPAAVAHAGLRVKLCDLDPDTLDFDYELLEKELDNKRLLCVITSHLFGCTVDVARLKAKVADRCLPVVEDAAQSFGGMYGSGKVGTLGDVGIFSLGRGKALSTVEGGIIITSRPDIATHLEKHFSSLPKYDFLDCLRLSAYAFALMCLLRPSFFWIPKLLPFLGMGETVYDPEFKIKKMSSLQAGLSRNWQQRLEQFQSLRKQISRKWSLLLQTLQQKHYFLEEHISGELIRFPWKIDSLNVRRQLLELSQRDGLGISRTYPSSIAGIPALADEFADKSYPIAKELAENILTLPVHPFLKPQDIEKIKRIVTGIIMDEGDDGND